MSEDDLNHESIDSWQIIRFPFQRSRGAGVSMKRRSGKVI